VVEIKIAYKNSRSRTVLSAKEGNKRTSTNKWIGEEGGIDNVNSRDLE
jgi:hypothetical protein